jgi:hypothetical protein
MASDVLPPEKGSRTKYLNIVYFVDSSKSYSIRINLVAARWALVLLIGVTLWSLISVAWVINLTQVVAKTRLSLGEALTGVYEYQVKYEKVFEKSYSSELKQVDVSSKSSESMSSNLNKNEKVSSNEQNSSNVEIGIVESSSTESPQISESLVETPLSIETKERDKVIEEDEIQIAKSQVDSLVVSKQAETLKVESIATSGGNNETGAHSIEMIIKNEALKVSNDSVLLQFDIVNKRQAEKAEGYIWAIAEFQDAQNTQIVERILAPQHATLMTDGELKSFKSTYKFSIQRFKTKDFAFQIPKMNQPSLTKLTVVYSNLKNSFQKPTAIPIPPEFQSMIDQKNEKISH